MIDDLVFCAKKIILIAFVLFFVFRTSKVSENLAKDVKETYEVLSEALEELLAAGGAQDMIEDALKLPLP